MLASMAAALLLGSLAFVIAAIVDATWLVVVGLGLIVLALIQRERLLGPGYWLLAGVAVLVGFLAQRLID
jgi:hypothetical protein